MHFIPSVLTVFVKKKKGKRKAAKFWYVSCILQIVRGQKLLILPGATDLVSTQFHLFMNTIIIEGHSGVIMPLLTFLYCYGVCSLHGNVRPRLRIG